jgi:hypothetical protein
MSEEVNVMANKIVLEIQNHVSTEARHFPECSALDSSIDDKLAGFVLGLLLEEENVSLAAHSLTCPMCIAKLYQLRTSLKSIRALSLVPDKIVENLDGINLFAEFERCVDEDIPDIPDIESEQSYSSAISTDESHAISSDTLSSTESRAVVESDETISSNGHPNSGRELKALVVAR